MTQRKIRIAFFTDVLRENLDGVTYTLYSIISRIPRERFEYLFITPYPPINKESVPYPVYVCPYIKFPLYGTYPLAFPAFSKKLQKTLDDFNPDMVHFTTPAFLGRYAVKYATSRNIPLFSTYHTHFLAYIDYYTFFKYIGGLKLWKRWCVQIMRWMYNRCALTFVPTDPIREELIDIGIDEHRLVTWGRGIDMTQFNPSFRDDDYIDRLAGPGTVRLLFVSRLVNEKEIDTLAKINRIITDRRPDIRMILTGDGPEKKYLERTMKNAIFTGKLTGPELSRIYASSDIFIFPSITETFGNVVQEALASGLPCVVAAKGGPKGIIKHGVTGFHARPKDAEDFVEKILGILDNPALFKKMKIESVAYARSQNWDDLSARMFSLYDQVLGDKKTEERVKDAIAVGNR